nr:hypothetical protein [uncultured Mediterranean phage uvMED]
MKRIHRDHLPEGAPIIIGPRGGQYYVNKDGEKIYITSSSRQPSRSFQFNHGKFKKWYEHQSEIN